MYKLRSMLPGHNGKSCSSGTGRGSAGERARTKPFMNSDDIHKFHLPCPLIEGNVCSVYMSPHPNVCKEFQCILLDQLLSGEINLEASLKIIVKIKKYINLINENVSFIDSSKSFMALIQDCWDLQQHLNEELLFDISACRYLLFRYIMSPSKPYSIDKLFLTPSSYETGTE